MRKEEEETMTIPAAAVATTATAATRLLHVVRVRYEGHEPFRPGADPTDGYAASGAWEVFGPPTVATPVLPDEARTGDPVVDLGILGGEIAAAVAAGRRAGRPVLVAGGTCGVTPGVVGGMQQAHGPGVRIGLVWFDAHGDFNTPQTTHSGMLGGMPVAVAAGLAHREWRERSRLVAPIPTDRILMVDVRNLDPEEAVLVRAVGIPVLSPAPGFPGGDLAAAVADLAARCDLLYLHIDVDILDLSLVPNHPTGEPNGPDVAQTLAAMETVFATGKVAVVALVSVRADGAGGAVSLRSGIELLAGSMAAWRRYGAPAG
jgi:arginase